MALKEPLDRCAVAILHCLGFAGWAAVHVTFSTWAVLTYSQHSGACQALLGSGVVVVALYFRMR